MASHFGDHRVDVEGHYRGEFGLCGIGEGGSKDFVFYGVGGNVGIEREARVAFGIGGGAAVEGSTR